MFDAKAPFSTQLNQYQRTVLGGVILAAQDKPSTMYAYSAMAALRELNPSMPPLPRRPW